MARLSGDFDGFYRREYGPIVRLLVGMTGRWGLAEELAQEALLAAYRRWPTVRALDRPDLWVRRVALNRAISTRRRLVAEVAAIARVRAEPLGAGDDVAAVVEGPVWAQVRELPRRQAAALVLWAVEGLTFTEIGEVLGVSEETARTHCRRARDQLGRSLSARSDDDD